MRKYLIYFCLFLSSCGKNSSPTPEKSIPETPVAAVESIKPCPRDLMLNLSVVDIKAMREAGVKIALSGERNVGVISENMNRSAILGAEILDLNNQPLSCLPGWLPKLKKLKMLILRNAELRIDEILSAHT